MSDIQLANIYFYVDGDLYTTKPDFDHTFITEAVDMDDLLKVVHSFVCHLGDEYKEADE
tara:strand:- start:600 stop:776 length:177 start_codon:yes stop_codon:yes gene_type:complete